MIITNPLTGRSETVPDTAKVTQADVDRTRRELREMLAGNVPFHVDPLAKPAEPSAAFPVLSDEPFDPEPLYVAREVAVDSLAILCSMFGIRPETAEAYEAHAKLHRPPAPDLVGDADA